MKILIILPRFPFPLEKGDKLRAYHFIKYLSKQHELILFALNDTRVKREYLEEINPFCKKIKITRIRRCIAYFNIIKAFFNGLPLQSGYFYSSKAKKEIYKLIEIHQPDYIFCQLIRIADYVKDIKIPKILDYQDAFSAGALRRMQIVPQPLKFILGLEYKRLQFYEKYCFDYFDHKIIISKTDRDLINHPKNHEIQIISNGVDTDYYKASEQEKTTDLLFTGNMAYPPNVHGVKYLVEQILPLVKKKYPGIRLLIAGAHPHHSIRALKSANVEVSGWIEDMRDCYAKSRVFIAPMLIGAGLQNKLLEAMSMGLPCITSPLANSALEAKENVEILVGSSVEQYAGHVFRLLEDPEYAKELGIQGKRFVIKNYSWDSAGEKLNQLLC